MTQAMAGASAIFHCLDLLEKEFDKAFVDLDVLIGESDFDDPEDMILEARDRMSTISSCFSQLCHKAQTTAQTNAKLEAEKMNLREELLLAKAKFDAASVESSNLVRQLHTLQIQLHAVKSGDGDYDSSSIKEKLDKELESFRAEATGHALLKEEVTVLKQEKVQLHQRVAALESELYGARLATKYLDKELAGRIQQIQLLGRNIKPPNFEKMWRQLEAEIQLHRHKTVIKACRGANKLPQPKENKALEHKRHGVGDVRKVVINKRPMEGLGISITGGREHGVPVLVSEIYEDSVVQNTGGLYVGDAILSVNGHDLRHAKHQEAVALLSQQVETLSLEVVFVSADDEDSDADDQKLVVEIAGEDQVNSVPTSNGEKKPSVSSNCDPLPSTPNLTANGSISTPDNDSDVPASTEDSPAISRSSQSHSDS